MRNKVRQLRQKRKNLSSLPTKTTNRHAPLSHLQHGIYFSQCLNPGETAYNNCIALLIKGELHIHLLEKAFQQVIEQHEILNIKITEHEGEIRQELESNNTVKIEVVEVAGDVKKATSELAGEMMRTVIPLSSWPLFRICLVKAQKDQYGLILMIHHLISDEISHQLIFRMFSTCYHQLLLNRPLATEPVPGYLEYCSWEQSFTGSKEFAESLQFWKDYLTPLPETLNWPESTATGKSEGNAAQSSRYFFSFSEAKKSAILTFCKSVNITPFVFLLTCLESAITIFTGQERFCIGIPSFNRSQWKDARHCVGVFMNSLPFLSEIDATKSLIQRTKANHIAFINLLDHQHVPFNHLVKTLTTDRDSDHHPLFQTLFSYLNIGELDWNFGGLQVETLNVEASSSVADLTLILRESEKGISGYFEFADYQKERIEDLATAFSTIVDQALLAPDTPFQELVVLSEQQQQTILSALQGKKQEELLNHTIVGLFKGCVEQYGDYPAVSDSSGSLSYVQLNELSDCLAQTIRAATHSDSSPVGVALERNRFLMVAILGILKAGCYYVPFEARWPLKRIESILESIPVELVLTDKNCDIAWPESVTNLSFDPTKPEGSNTKAELSVSPDSRAYTLFTSGSTGVPKGVQVLHKTVCQRALWVKQHYDLKISETYLCISPLSFDLSVDEMFTPVLSGCHLFIADIKLRNNINQLCDLVVRKRINHLSMTPGLLEPLSHALDSNPDLNFLRTITSCGDILQSDTAQRLLSKIHGRLFNTYGPTEATVSVTCHEVSNQATEVKTLPIGSPIANCSILILDKFGRIVPKGIYGELYIAGDCLAEGYLLKEQTEAAFVNLKKPFSTRAYKTGDLGRLNSKLELEFFKRNDTQVKIRGYRIEIGEIEFHLKRLPLVKEACVVAKVLPNGNKRLCGFVVLSGKQKSQEIGKRLSQSIPHYMVPEEWFVLDEMPYTHSFKIDRKALLRKARTSEYPGDNKREGDDFRSEEEILMARLWESVLRVKQVNPEDDFFALGGDSISILQLVARLKKNKLNIQPSDFYKGKSIRGILASANTTEKLIKPVSIAEQEEQCSAWNKRLKLFKRQLAPDTGLKKPKYCNEILFELDGADVQRWRSHLVKYWNLTFEQALLATLCSSFSASFDKAPLIHLRGFGNKKDELLAITQDHAIDLFSFAQEICNLQTKSSGSRFLVQKMEEDPVLANELNPFFVSFNRSNLPKYTPDLSISVIDQQDKFRIVASFNSLRTLPSQFLNFKMSFESQLKKWMNHGSQAKILALSDLQKSILFKVKENNHLYHTAIRLKLEGDFPGLEELKALVSSVVERYEVFKAEIDENAFVEPVLKIYPNRQYRAEENGQPGRFNLTSHLWKMAVGFLPHGLLKIDFSVNDILLDGWSLALFFEDLIQTIGGRIGNVQHKIDLPEKLLREGLNPDYYEAESFWKYHLYDATQLQLPMFSETDIDEQGKIDVQLSSEVTRDLQTVSRKHGVSLNNLFQAFWFQALSVISNSNDILVANILSGRSNLQEVAETYIGNRLETVPFRARIDESKRFKEWVLDLQDQFQRVMTLPHLPFNELLSRYASNVQVNALMIFENFPHQFKKNDPQDLIRIRAFEIQENLHFPVVLFVNPGTEFSLNLTWSKSQISDSTAILLSNLIKMYAECCAQKFEENLANWPQLPDDVERHLVFDLNSTERNYEGSDKTLADLFLTSSRFHAANVAIQLGDRSLTYRQLTEASLKVAGYINKKVTDKTKPIAVIGERSTELIMGIMGIVLSGAAYLPMEQGLGSERLRKMAAKAKADLLLAAPGCGNTDWFAGQVTEIGQILSSHPMTQPENFGNDRIAYCMFTSGTTGEPKGVSNSHKAIVNRLLWMQEAYLLNASSRVLFKTTTTFDVSVWEIFWPLITGATMIIAPPDAHKNQKQLERVINEQGVTHLHFVPSLLNSFLNHMADKKLNVEKVFVSGEALTPELAETFFEHSSAELHNLYGPTEAAIDVTFHQVLSGKEKKSIPIGRPIANTQIYILDRLKRPVPPNVIGELYIGGDGLAEGYINAPDLTGEAFVEFRGQRVYRTRDLAYFDNDGTIYYMGRNDRQVKISGVRIELAEIEAVLREHDGIDMGVVVHVTEPTSRLIAFIKKKEGSLRLSSQEMNLSLRKKLPSAMIPSQFVFVDSFPLNKNGKTDIQELKKLIDHRLTKIPVPLSNRLEQTLADLWQNLLGCGTIHQEDSFTMLGGNSIHAFSLSRQLDKTLKIKIPPSYFLSHPAFDQHIKIINQTHGHLALLQSQLEEGHLPVVFVAPMTGLCMVYDKLWRSMNYKGPVFALENVETNYNSIAELAEIYVQDIKKAFDSCILIGHSFAGFVASEVTSRLADRVSQVILIDSSFYDITAQRPPQIDRNAAIKDMKTYFNLGDFAEEKLGTSIADQLNYKTALDSEIIEAVIDCFIHNYQLVWDHKAKPVPNRVKIDLIRARENDFGQTRDLDVSASLDRDIAVHWSDGDHFTMLNPPHAGKLAELINRLVVKMDSA